MKIKGLGDWIIRFVKGMFVGTGFILPGVSGGVLAAIFGLYGRLIAFLAHITKNIKANIRFFLPVALGMLAGVVVLAYPLDLFLDRYPAPTLWFFIGAISGTLPFLWKDAGQRGRKPRHIIVLIGAAIVAFAFLLFGKELFCDNVPQNFGTWIIAGAIIALGILVPGLSSSNFLLYMGMYGAMLAAFKTLDMTVLLPLAVGLVLCMLTFAKLMDLLFAKAYAAMYHVIVGIVLASTVMIVPLDFNYMSLGMLACLSTCVCGVALSYFMCSLEKKYKHRMKQILRRPTKMTNKGEI